MSNRRANLKSLNYNQLMKQNDLKTHTENRIIQSRMTLANAELKRKQEELKRKLAEEKQKKAAAERAARRAAEARRQQSERILQSIPSRAG